MNFNVNWVFPHPEGPLTMELNGCLQDGSILQNEEDTGLNVILILSFIFHIISKMFIFIYRMFIVFANYIQSVECSYLYTECSLYVQKFIYNLQFIRVFSFQGDFIVTI